jgi:hypothetical protein
MRPLSDEFTAAPISRQRKYQLRHQKLGLCAKSSNRQESGGLCAACKAKRHKLPTVCTTSTTTTTLQ